jgi:hypothetical protein
LPAKSVYDIVETDHIRTTSLSREDSVRHHVHTSNDFALQVFFNRGIRQNLSM